MSAPAEPHVATLGGHAPSRVLLRYLLATRPAFLTASVMPVVVGTAWGAAVAGRLHALAATLALLATVLVHAAANVLNDVADGESGTDDANVERMYPFTGGSRFIQTGVLDIGQMRRWGITLLVASLGVGAWLTAVSGITIVGLGLVGIALAVAYSMRPFALASRGIGELVIGVAFGVLPVMGATWLQTGTFDVASLLVSLPVSGWVTAILLINEVPDMRADRSAGKATFPVRFGIGATRVLYVLLHALAPAATLALVLGGHLHVAAMLGVLVTFALGLVSARGIVDAASSEREKLRASIARTIPIHALGSLWLTCFAWFGS